MSHQSERQPTVLGYPGFREGHGLGTDAWRHTSSNNLNEPNSDDEETWKILNEQSEQRRIDEYNRVKQNELQQAQQRMFEEAKNSESPGKVKILNGVFESPTKSGIARKLMLDKSSRAGKSRRVFRKKTKITRRSNKKSNRSRSHRHHRHHHHRRTSHVAKQT
jgi:hypothetical protein